MFWTGPNSREIRSVGQNCLFDVVMVWHVPDWAEQSGKALDAVGQTGPVGSTDYPVGYGLYPVASWMMSKTRPHLQGDENNPNARARERALQLRLQLQLELQLEMEL